MGCRILHGDGGWADGLLRTDRHCARLAKVVVAIGGVATLVWGGIVARMSLGGPWRRITAFVTVTNAAAAGVLTIIVLAADVGPAAAVVLLGAALQVVAFAAIQAHALWSPFVR
jgi:hypothetical protein